jgi:hypothetical protein
MAGGSGLDLAAEHVEVIVSCLVGIVRKMAFKPLSEPVFGEHISLMGGDAVHEGG